MKYELGKRDEKTGLHRIVALRDIPRHGIKTGDIGGFVEGGKNLSQDGDAWIGGDAQVYGNACVFGDSHVRDNAHVCGDAQVFGNAQVYGNTWIYGNTRIRGNSQIYGNAHVYDNTMICGDAQIYDNADISGNSLIGGDAQVYGNSQIYGNTELYTNMLGFGNTQALDYETLTKALEKNLETEEQNPFSEIREAIVHDKATKLHLETMRNEVILNCPDEDHPLRKKARGIMVNFQNISFDAPVSQRIALKMLEIVEQSQTPRQLQSREYSLGH
jgi:carbonic anhydrase/acetyltransferase-like protein (isoleucine patch superfamily)